MSRNKIFLAVTLFVLVLIITTAAFLFNVRSGFIEHLEKRYPEQNFSVGFVKIDPIYGSYIANVTSLNDDISFPISRSFQTKKIHEDYPQYKSRIQYNAKLKNIFESSDLKYSVRQVTGSGKIPFQNGDQYNQINIYLSAEHEITLIAVKVLSLLKDNHISSDKIIFTQEKEKHVYELHLVKSDLNLNQAELKAKIQRVK